MKEFQYFHEKIKIFVIVIMNLYSGSFDNKVIKHYHVPKSGGTTIFNMTQRWNTFKRAHPKKIVLARNIAKIPTKNLNCLKSAITTPPLL